MIGDNKLFKFLLFFSLSGLDLSPTTAAKIDLGSSEVNTISKIKQNISLSDLNSSQSQSATNVSKDVESTKTVSAGESSALPEPPLYNLDDRTTREK